MLVEIENQLYDEIPPSGKEMSGEGEGEEGGVNEGDRTRERGHFEGRERNEFDWSKGNVLERRHNFETHNRPQLLHMEPRCEEWTSLFPHLRVVGHQLTTLEPRGEDIMPTVDCSNNSGASTRFHTVTSGENKTGLSMLGVGL